MIVMNKATKGTTEELIEVSDLEVNNNAVRSDKKNDEEEPIKLSSTSSNQIPSWLEHEYDPLESIVMNDEAHGEVTIVGRDFPDNSTYQANFPTIRDQFDRKYIHARQMNEDQQLQNQAKIKEMNDGRGDTISSNNKNQHT